MDLPVELQVLFPRLVLVDNLLDKLPIEVILEEEEDGEEEGEEADDNDESDVVGICFGEVLHELVNLVDYLVQQVVLVFYQVVDSVSVFKQEQFLAGSCHHVARHRITGNLAGAFDNSLVVEGLSGAFNPAVFEVVEVTGQVEGEPFGVVNLADVILD